MLQTFIEEHVPHITRTPNIPEDVEKLDRITDLLIDPH